jgi:Phage head-tail joining protein
MPSERSAPLATPPPSSELRSLVGFYQRQTVPDVPDTGNEQTDFPDVPTFTCAANIKPRLGGENVLASRLTGVNLVNITVRRTTQTAAVDTAWRAKDERSGAIYNVRSVIDPFEHTADHDRFLEMLCEKGGA